jgi:hypothetical protein
MDISACGRQLFPGSQLEKLKIQEHFQQYGNDDPSQNGIRKNPQNFEGDNKFFWRSLRLSIENTFIPR